MSPAVRKVLFVLAVAFALATPGLQALTGWGLSAGQFAEQGDQTLRAAPYAFSIWGLIYLALIAHAGFHVLAPPRAEPVLRNVAPAVVAIAGCGLWLIASGANWRWASVLIILTSALFALWALYRARGQAQTLPVSVLAVWPIAMLGGWLLIASVINILTVATAEGLITANIAPSAAVGAVVVAVMLTLLIVRSGVCALYGGPVAWGLIAVYVAERSDNPASANVAVTGAAVVALFSAWTAFRRWRADPKAGSQARP